MGTAEGRESFEVPADLDGARIDVVLARLVPDRSRTRLQALIREGRVSLDGSPVSRANVPVTAGAVLEVDLSPDARASSAPVEHFELTILYEDDDVVVVDKPAGLVVHPNERYPTGTLSDLAAARYGELPHVQGADRPGIVHRLDRLTSGVILLGRTRPALEDLKRQFKERSVAKTYLAVVHGDPRFDTDWIEGSIAPSETHRDRFRVVAEGSGREASTYYEVRERFRGFAFLACQPKTGRTHQIRVHLHSAGLPIVGDRNYRHPGALPVPLPADAPPMTRQALHAHKLEFDHPVTGERVAFTSPMPADMEALVAFLRERMPLVSP